MIAAARPAVGDLLTVWRTISSIAGILIIAFIVGRLLGARRSAGAVLASGLIGWAAGATLAVVIADNQTNAQAGFVRHLWLFSAFFTMSATVWIEMLARPGALTRAQHRVTSVPRPLRALRREGQRVERYGQIVHLAARYGLGRSLGVTEDETGPDGRAPMPVRLRRALEEAGGMFVKLGQVLSTRSDLLPADFIAELSRLQDHVPPAPQAMVAALLAAELGRPVEEVFATFEWEPVAAASIAQAHRACLQSGETVIVKVQRPGIAEVVERDLDVLARLVAALEERASWAAEYGVATLAKEFADRIREELDFRVEGGNATELAHNMETVPGVRIPRVHPELTTSRMLVMEWLDGPSARQVARIDAMGLDRVHLADVLLRSSLHQMMVDGHFHADPHPGNVLVLSDGSIGLIDFGATGRLDSIEQASVRQMMIAVARHDPVLLSQAVLQTASVRRGFDDDQFERALARFMARFLAPGVPPSAAMFTPLLQLMFTFGAVLPAEFSTCFRTLVTLEGTLRTLSPGYQVIEMAEQMAMEWGRSRLKVATAEELAKAEVLRLAPVLRRLPRHLDRIATIVERGDLQARVSLFSQPEDVRTVTKLVNRVLLAVIGCLVGVISVVLIGVKGGPMFTGGTSLYQFFGYFGLACSTVLIMRVLVAILGEGLN